MALHSLKENTAVLFDLDGTLLDTLGDLTDAVNHVLARRGCPLQSTESVRTHLGSGAKHLIQNLLPEETDEETLSAVLQEYMAYYEANCRNKTQPYAGIPEALAEIARCHPVAIVSNKPDGAVKALCARFFPGIYAQGESNLCPRKPAPDMLHYAMKAIGAQSCVYVGDSEVDILTAQNAGMPCLSVTWGFRDEEMLKDAGARHICRHTDELASSLEALL